MNCGCYTLAASIWVMNITMVILTSINYNRVNTYNDLAVLKLSVVQQVPSDWSVRPFVEISVSETECSANEVPVFSKLWQGLMEGCLLFEADTDEFEEQFMTTAYYNSMIVSY